jgi:hypothetical protein
VGRHTEEVSVRRPSPSYLILHAYLAEILLRAISVYTFQLRGAPKRFRLKPTQDYDPQDSQTRVDPRSTTHPHTQPYRVPTSPITSTIPPEQLRMNMIMMIQLRSILLHDLLRVCHRIHSVNLHFRLIHLLFLWMFILP